MYRDRGVDVRRIGEELGVRYVIHGSIRRSGGTIRLNAQLIETTRGEHLWAERFACSLDDIFDAQDRIVESVLGVIEPQIQKNEIERAHHKRPENLDAYDLYLRALRLLESPIADEIDRAIMLLDRAVKLDPGCSTALIAASLARERRFMLARGASGWDDDAAVALDLMEQAVAADPDDAAVLAISACELVYFKGDFDRALAHCDRALVSGITNG